LSFILSMIIPVLSFYFFLPIKFLISYILFFVDFFLSIPASSFQINYFSFSLIILYYLLIFSFILFHNYKNPNIRVD
jgi:hypothetical protein